MTAMKPSTLRIGKRYRPNRLAAEYDAIVIGSGMGGLTTAALLSEVGWRVCVLEQSHHSPAPLACMRKIVGGLRRHRENVLELNASLLERARARHLQAVESDEQRVVRSTRQGLELGPRDRPAPGVQPIVESTRKVEQLCVE